MKRCRKCIQIKDDTEYYKNKGYLSSYCKTCYKEYYLLYKESDAGKNARVKSSYGISLDDVNEMYRLQEGKCAICSEFKSSVGQSGLYIDHNHDTGQVRGLLCNSCNVGLGQFKDSIDLLIKAIDYLEKSKAQPLRAEPD